MRADGGRSQRGGAPMEITDVRVFPVDEDKLKGIKSDSNLPPPSQVVDITS